MNSHMLTGADPQESGYGSLTRQFLDRAPDEPSDQQLFLLMLSLQNLSSLSHSDWKPIFGNRFEANSFL